MLLLLWKKKKFVRFLMLDRVFGDWLDIYVQMIIIANPKKEPPRIDVVVAVEEEEICQIFNVRSCIWRLVRHLCANDYKYPKFSGWIILLMQATASAAIKQTVTTYLPPLNSPVTEFATIFKYLTYMQSLAQSVNMPYVNVFLDVSAVMNAYKLVWNYPDKFSNVLVHLGEFHFIKEIFNVVRTMIDRYGSLVSVINGSHFNRCWRVHRPFAEALESFLMERFIDYKQLAIPETVIAFTESIQVKDNDETVVNDQGVQVFHRQYLEFQERCRVGDFERTAHFWVALCLDIIEVLHMIHYAVQINNFDLRMIAWKKMLLFFFAMNKTNYSRYGSYYLRMLEPIELQYPGCKELLLSAGLSVQAQDHYSNRTAIDQRKEQSINRDVKTESCSKCIASKQGQCHCSYSRSNGFSTHYDQDS